VRQGEAGWRRRKWSQLLRLDLARDVNNGFAMTNTNRLDNIATRQRKTRVRDAFFAACIALAAVISLSSLHTAASAASTSTPTTHIAQR
jgi:hypothetical protein